MRAAELLKERYFSGVNPHPDKEYHRAYAEAVDAYEDNRLEDVSKFLTTYLVKYAHDADLVALLANSFFYTGRAKEARTSFERLIELAPDKAYAFGLYGTFFQECKKYDEMHRPFRQSIALDPDKAEHRLNYATALVEAHQYAAARDLIREVRESHPQNVVAKRMNIVINYYLGDLETGLAASQEAMAEHPTAGPFRYLYADGLFRLAQFKDASTHAVEAMKLGGMSIDDMHNVCFTAGLCFLGFGDLERGWPAYLHSRLNRSYSFGMELVDAGDEWTVETDLSDKTLYVYTEQGLGDEILFYPIIEDLKTKCKSLVLICEPRLASLFARTFPDVAVRPRHVAKRGTVVLLSPDDPDGTLPPPDVHAFIGAFLPLLRPSVDAFPAEPRRLVVDAAQKERWSARLKEVGPGPYVGICWRSGMRSVKRNFHYASIGTWADALKDIDATFVSLQYDDCRAELVAARERGFHIVDFSSEIDLKNDIDNNAALCASLDLVASANTAAGALSAAVGTPTIWVSALKIWTMLGKADSIPFYGTKNTVLHPDRLGDWDAVFPRLRDELVRLGRRGA